MYSIGWGILTIIFIILEAMTVSLVSIWFCTGTLIALLLSLIKAPFVVQIIAFLIVSIVSLLLVKPLADKHLKYIKTNADSIIGRECKVVEDISNLNDTGRIAINGTTWKAKTSDNEEIKKDSLVRITKIEGVSAIVEII